MVGCVGAKKRIGVSARKNQFPSFPISVESKSGVLPANVGPDEICLWYASLEQLGRDWIKIEKLLSFDEREKSERFIFEKDKKRYVLRHGVLRMILGSCLALQPAHVPLSYEHHGKPVLVGTDLSFNMSESAGYAVYAVTRRRRIGVDIEQIRAFPEMDSIARSLFCKSEYEFLCGRPESQKQRMFFELWARKEAVLKAIGKGLTIPLDTLNVLVNSDESVRQVRLDGVWGEERQWTLYDLGQDSGFAIAVAVECPYALPLHTHFFPSIWGEDKGKIDERRRFRKK
jgi:4'-phosphopantetheinyl transferase